MLLQECATIRDKIKNDYRIEGKSLNCEVLPTVRIAHQNFAIRLLKWLGELFNKFSGFRALFISVAQSVGSLLPFDCWFLIW